jgi:CheY-like chemotaxis protein
MKILRNLMSRCVVVVEDEALVNMFTASELRAVGYEVLTAFDADEAIRILEERNVSSRRPQDSAGPRLKSSSQPGRLRSRGNRCLREVPLFVSPTKFRMSSRQCTASGD